MWEKLKKRGLTSPYLRPFVVARSTPIRFSTSTEFDFDNVLGRMQKASAARFNVDRVKQEDVVRAGGGGGQGGGGVTGPRCARCAMRDPRSAAARVAVER